MIGIINTLLGGILLGLALWLSIKIVDKDNRSNTVIGGLIIGILLQVILLFLGFIGILTSFVILVAIFKYYEIGIGETIVIFIILVSIKVGIGYLLGFLI